MQDERKVLKMKFKEAGKKLLTRAAAIGLAVEMGVRPVFALTTAELTSKFTEGIGEIQTVVSGIATAIGIACIMKIIITKLPNIQEPHVKSEMWQGIGQVLIAIAAVAAIVWIAPWMYEIFK